MPGIYEVSALSNRCDAEELSVYKLPSRLEFMVFTIGLSAYSPDIQGLCVLVWGSGA
jgi:hypothetical protein